MAVLPMERIHVLAMKRDRKAILELLQRRGTVEIRDAGEGDEVFDKADTSATQALMKRNAETAAHAVEVLGRYTEEKKPALAFLRGRTAVPVKVSNDFYSQVDNVMRAAQQVVQRERDIAEAKAEVAKVEAQQEALVPWMDLPIPQSFAGTKKTAVFIGSIGGEHTLEGILEKLAEVSPELGSIHLEIVHASKEQTEFYAIVLKSEAEKAEEALRAIGFTRPSGPSHLMPREKAKRLEAQRTAALNAVEKAEEDIRSFEGRRDDFRFLEDHMTMRAEKYGVIERLAQSKHVFVLDGYVPEKAAAGLQQEIAGKFEASVELVHPSGEEDVPVLLQNNQFAEPAETILESYSLPGKGEIDPTNVMSIFYYFMFGLMFSDAGYGVIMSGVCLACLLIFKNMEPNWKKNLKMFFWCGVSTMFWGIMFGSYFGDALTVVSGNFFGHAILVKPVWLDPMQQPMQLLLVCFAIGIVHLSMGMVLKAVTYSRNKMYIDILFDVVFPLLCIYPLILMLMGSEMFEGMSGFRLALPPIANTICLGIVGVAMLGVLITGGRESRNWGKRLLKGAYALYNVLAGWLGDILSYSRLLALGLATGVIGSVINTMGAMTGTGVFAFLIFIVIFLLGHALNFGINVLGAYVHSNRLEFVEFFGKFYEGGGRKFEPFGIHTKHYKIEEETQNV